jgi:hypothetical protein
MNNLFNKIRNILLSIAIPVAAFATLLFSRRNR